MQHYWTSLNSTLLDGVGLRGQTNATCCAVLTRISEIRDLRRIMIPNFRRNYLLLLPERWLAARARVQQCWSARSKECDLVVHTWEQKKCWTMLHEMADGNQTLFNIKQHDTTWCNMVAKRVQHVAFNNVERCWIVMLHLFVQGFTFFKGSYFVLAFAFTQWIGDGIKSLIQML